MDVLKIMQGFYMLTVQIEVSISKGKEDDNWGLKIDAGFIAV